MGKINLDIDLLTEDQAKNLLTIIVNKLDELDEEDYFGTQGWLYFFGLTDK